VFVLEREPADLRPRIEARVDRMFAAGLVAETRALLDRGLAANRTALQALGYRQVVEHLRGERDLAATIALVKSRTWQFARRQRTWFRRQLPAEFIPVAPDESVSSIAGRLMDLFSRR
jgi:tRNA dimethylallyltransferase